MWLLGLAAFALTVAESIVYVKQTKAVVAGSAVKAANWATAFEALLFFDVLLIVHSWWFLPPILAGAWLGMYWTVKQRDQ